MKNCCLLFFGLFFVTAAIAQSNNFYYPDAFYFVKEVKTDGLKGKAFHFEVSVKENPADTISKPRIYAIQVRKGKEDVIGKTLIYATTANGDWKTYSIDGAIDEEASRIWFYMSVNGNGDFYFDKLQYSVADATGNLKPQDLVNASFEETGKQVLKGYYTSKLTSPQFKLISSDNPVLDGKYSLHIFTGGMKASANAIAVVK